MKSLGVLRHAKSSWDGPHRDDLDRPLNARGWKAARRLGREFVHRGRCFDLVLASPAARVRETIDALFETVKAEIRFEPRLYLASAEELFEIVRTLGESVRAPLIVGHNPGLQKLIIDLTQDNGLRKTVIDKFPTAAFARVELPAEHWKTIEPQSGTIVEIILEKELS
jgi:phosphohistidine phosphatase